ncbi:hypothetical protein [Bacillus cereus]|nr:hypothetical protein [Bacillus cereus]
MNVVEYLVGSDETELFCCKRGGVSVGSDETELFCCERGGV